MRRCKVNSIEPQHCHICILLICRKELPKSVANLHLKNKTKQKTQHTNQEILVPDFLQKKNRLWSYVTPSTAHPKCKQEVQSNNTDSLISSSVIFLK